MGRAWLAVVLAGCSSNFGAADAHLDTPSDVGLGDAAQCTPPPTAKFSTPTLVGALSSPQFDGLPSMTADELDVFFKSGRPDDVTVRIWHATRASPISAWSTPTMVSELNSNMYDTSPTISGDGLTIWFVSYRTGGPGGGDFYVAKRSTRTGTFNTPQLVTELNTTEYEDALALVEPDELIGYFHSKRGGSAVSHIYRTTRPSAAATWTTPVELPELVSTYEDNNVWASPDDCTIYFDTTRPGGQGSFDVFVATRPGPGARFSRIAPVTELNGTSYDADPFLTADQRYIMYTSDRGGNFNIYEASR
jgi:Tol biopolymer transport system component